MQNNDTAFNQVIGTCTLSLSVNRLLTKQESICSTPASSVQPSARDGNHLDSPLANCRGTDDFRSSAEL